MKIQLKSIYSNHAKITGALQNQGPEVIRHRFSQGSLNSWTTADFWPEEAQPAKNFLRQYRKNIEARPVCASRRGARFRTVNDKELAALLEHRQRHSGAAIDTSDETLTLLAAALQ